MAKEKIVDNVFIKSQELQSISKTYLVEIKIPRKVITVWVTVDNDGVSWGYEDIYSPPKLQDGMYDKIDELIFYNFG